MVLRDFRREDQEALRQLILEGLRERWGDAFDPVFNPDLNDFVANYLDRGAEVVVVERQGELVATGTLVPEPPGAGRIMRMSVSAAHRREGLGRRVVGELVARARRRGMVEVRVLTDTPWTSAVELYRACGFTDIGPLRPPELAPADNLGRGFRTLRLTRHQRHLVDGSRGFAGLSRTASAVVKGST